MTRKPFLAVNSPKIGSELIQFKGNILCCDLQTEAKHTLHILFYVTHNISPICRTNTFNPQPSGPWPVNNTANGIVLHTKLLLGLMGAAPPPAFFPLTLCHPLLWKAPAPREREGGLSPSNAEPPSCFELPFLSLAEMEMTFFFYT